MDRHRSPGPGSSRCVNELAHRFFCFYLFIYNSNLLVTLIGEAVFARCLSALKEERVRASKVIAGPPKEPFRGDKQLFIDDLEQALYASKIISYTQGFMLMRTTAKEVNYKRKNRY